MIRFAHFQWKNFANKYGIAICAILSLLGTSHSASVDPQSFPKGQLLKNAPQPNVPDLSSARLEHHVYSHRFDGSSETWEMTGAWHVSGSSAPAGVVAVLSSTKEAGYQADTNDRSVGPMIVLPPIQHATQKLILELREKYEIESFYDQAFVEVSKDGGQSWEPVHSRSGQSDWRETSVDVSQFSGESIRFGFRLHSNESIGFSGWQIESIDLVIQEAQQLSASLVSLNAQGFPYIYMNVAAATGSSILSQTNFSVYENGILQTDYFQVTPPQSGGGSRLADIVFLMDNSGSMSGEQAAVRNNVSVFVNNLAASGVNYALALCRFGMNAGNGDPVFENNGQFTQDPEYFKNVLWMRNTVDGGREPGYDAIVQAARAFSFRPGAQKIFIQITDEKPDQGSSSMNNALTSCTSGSITLFVLTVAELNSYFSAITAATNGAIFDIYSNFNTILQYVSSTVSNNYVVQYRSSNPAADGTERRVEVRIAWNSEKVSVWGSYIPGAVPQIKRTAATVALERQAWAAQSVLRIEVEVTDRSAPYVSTVILYCRNTGAGSYQAIPLSQGAGSIWSGQIPSQFVNAPGVDYFITATDGQTTVSTPAVNPIDSPFQIAILPNSAPEIIHTPITQAASGVSIPVTAEVRDVTNRLASVELYYKRTGQLTYQTVNFSYISGNTYRSEIPSSYATTGGVDYFIRAMDDLGVSTTMGTFDLPYHITISGGGSWQPTLLDPVANKVGVGIDLWLSWLASTGATSYQIQLDDDSNFSSPVLSRDNYTTTRIYHSKLDYNKQYYWRVQAKNSTGTSDWSQVFGFKTMSQPPVTIKTPNQYVLAYLQEGDQCYTDRDYVLQTLPPGIKFNLYIKTANADKGNSSTSYISFTLDKPAIIYIAYDERASSLPNWLTSTFARTDKKILLHETDGSVRSMAIWTKSLQSGTHLLGGNLADGAAGAKTNFLVLFSVDFDPFALPVIVSPADSAQNVPTNPTRFVWRKYPGARWYHFNLNTAKTSANVIVYDYGLTDTTFLVNNLELKKTYYWRIRASDADRRTEWTPYYEFTTGTPPVITGIAISGPPEIQGNFSADYVCTATYSDGTIENVTNRTTWSENSVYADISNNGRLTAMGAGSDQLCTITAVYSGFLATKDVTIKHVRVPIIFIPGIMGSPLYNDADKNNALSDKELVWIRKTKMFWSIPDDFLHTLQLDESGTAPQLGSFNIKVAPLRGDAGNTLVDVLKILPLSTYEGFFNYFEKIGYTLDKTNIETPMPNIDLYCFSYDWRKSIAWNGEKLSSYIDFVLKWTHSSQVNIVAHSMGGLVTKSCVKHYNKQRIDKIVFIGTPHLGAPKLYYAMLTGDTELGWFSDLVVRNKVIRDITRNFPSTYQLFPSSEYFLNNPFSLVKLQYSPFSPLPYFESLNYSDGIRFFKEQKTIWGDEVFNNGLIDLSQSVQSDLKQIDFGDIELYNIVGYGNSCIGHVIVNYYAGIRTSVDPIYSLDGDETVPLQSAETINQTVHSAKNTFYVSGADHSGLPSNGEVLNIIQNVLQIPPISVTKPKPMNYSYNALNIWQTLVACPVEVHVYDAAGRHTGPTSDSTYVEEIPGSRYLPANLSNPESKKVFLLPKGGSYRFEISSQDTSGFFDFRAYEIVNGKLVKFVSFDSVEFEPSTLAECVLRTISPDVAITVDKDGDGDIDSTYHTKAGTPTSVAENEKTEIPKDFILYQNYPNPFNNRTTIKFDLPRSEYVTLELYNASGQRILTLLNGSMHAGRHEVTVDASTLSSGVYLCRLRAGQSARTIKIGLIR